MVWKGAKVYTENHIFEKKDLYIKGRRIESGSPGEGEAVFDASGLYAIPGLVDIHFHGCVGEDLCEADEEGLRKIAQYQAENGVLAICPATMTYGEEKLSRICQQIAAFAEKQDEKAEGMEADLVGIHLEGPFLSEEKLGAQNPAYLALPDAAMVDRLQEKAKGLIKLVDVAPELEGSEAFIRELGEKMKISLAHTNATYEQALQAFEAGAEHITHLYNAMPGMHHRMPGPVIAAMEQGTEAELICDGVHVHPAMVRLTFKLFGSDKVILISDSMEACGLPDGVYQLGGQSVTVKGNRAVLTESPVTIAGSTTNLLKCMRVAVKEAGISLEDAVRACTENPARAIGVEDVYGSLTPGHMANVVFLDEELQIRAIIQKGKLYQ